MSEEVRSLHEGVNDFLKGKRILKKRTNIKIGDSILIRSPKNDTYYEYADVIRFCKNGHIEVRTEDFEVRLFVERKGDEFFIVTRNRK